jgi:hypothetical protein
MKTYKVRTDTGYDVEVQAHHVETCRDFVLFYGDGGVVACFYKPLMVQVKP